MSKKTAKRSNATITSLGSLTRKTDRKKLDPETWVVFRGNASERKPLLFDASLSRDEVRGAYARETGVNHDRTRSRRLSNY